MRWFPLLVEGMAVPLCLAGICFTACAIVLGLPFGLRMHDISSIGLDIGAYHLGTAIDRAVVMSEQLKGRASYHYHQHPPLPHPLLHHPGRQSKSGLLCLSSLVLFCFCFVLLVIL
jgi:hypothetical protein